MLDGVVESLYSHAVDDVHLGVKFASLLKNHIRGLRERFVQVETPMNLPSTPFFDGVATQQGQIGVLADAADIHQHITYQEQGQHLSVGSQIQELSEEHVGEIGFGDIHDAPGVRDNLFGGGDGSLPSADDWFELPINISDDGFGNAFMQSFFEIGSIDERFFWDISL